jgi:hypothetical protein
MPKLVDIEFILRGARANFNADGRLAPVAFIFGAPSEPPIMLGLQLGSVEDKERTACGLRALAQKPGTRMVATATEQWVGVTQASHRYARRHGTLAGAPGVRELVCVAVERPKEITMHTAEIVRAGGVTLLGPWEQTIVPRSEASGLFIGLLDPEA